MKMSIGSLINQGNACFLAGKQIDAMMHYIEALKKAGAFESVVKYVNKHREDLYENQRILHQLLSTKYHLHFIPGTLSFFLITIKNQLEEMERKEDYQRFKKINARKTSENC